MLTGDTTAKDTTNMYIYASHNMLFIVDVDNLITIDTPDVTFIGSQDKAHEIKSIVRFLQKKAKMRCTLITRHIARVAGLTQLKLVIIFK